MKYKHDIEKKFYEHMAKMVLEQCVEEPRYRLRHSDSPDLVNYNGIGVEVTRALYPGDAEAESLYTLSVNKSLNEIKESLLNRIDEIGYEFVMWNGKVAAVGPKEAIWESTKEVEVAFLDKLEKAPKYGDKIELFIFAPPIEYCNLKIINEFTEWAINKQENKNSFFNKIYIFDFTYLYICDLLKNDVKSIFIDNETIKSLKVSSIAFAEEES